MPSNLSGYRLNCSKHKTYLNAWAYLRLLPTFASVLLEKIRTRASFTKILANYMSEEHLVYNKNII